MSSTVNDIEMLQRAYRYALALTGNPAEAEDLSQQAWLRIFERYGALRRGSALLTAVRNLFIDGYRRARKVELVAVEDLDREPADPVMPRLDDGDLERLLAALRVQEREALYLHAVEGYTAAEIAQRTGRSRGTVLSLIHRARAKLATAAAALSPQAENG